MKLKVHRTLCAGHHECHRFAPDLYLLDEDGIIDLHKVEVPAGLERSALMGACCCPTSAITVIEE